jgi:hypothetical protein
MADDIDAILARYAPKAAAAPARDPIDDVLERYAPPKPKEPTPTPSARDVALAVPPDEAEGPTHDPALDYWGAADQIVSRLTSLKRKSSPGDVDNSYIDQSRGRAELLHKLNDSPDDTVMFDGPNGPMTAGQMRAVKTTGDTIRQVAAGGTVGNAAAKAIGSALPVVGSAVGQVIKHGLTSGGGAAAGQAAADLTSDVPLEEIPGRALEAGKFGAVLGSGSKVAGDVAQDVGAWAGRARSNQAFEDLSVGASKKQKGQLYQKEPQVREALERHDLNDLTGKAAKLQPAAAAKLEGVGKAIGHVDERVTQESGGMPITKVMRAIDKVAQKYEQPGSHAIAEKINKLAEEVRDDWRDKFPVVNSVTRVPLGEVRKLSSRLGEAAFAADPSIPAKTATRAQKELYGALRDEMSGHIEATMEAKPALRKELGDVKALERDYGNLKLVKDIATTRAPAQRFEGKSRFSKVIDEHGNKSATLLGLGLGAAKAIGGAGSRIAVSALASLANKAAAGAATADDIATAIAAGVPKGVAEGVVRNRQSPAEAQP